MNTAIHEAELVAKLMRECPNYTGDKITLLIEEIPEATGSYAVYDGLDIRGAGVTWNMRQSVQDLRRDLKRPIFLWRLDTDGSVDLWLRGKIRCSRCNAEMDIDDEEAHKFKVHGIDSSEDDEDI